MPDAPLPLSAALLPCMAPDGYLTAAAQAALLESYAGATAASVLADDARHEHRPPPAPPTTRGHGLRARRRSTARQAPSPSRGNADEGCQGVPTCPAGDGDDAATAKMRWTWPKSYEELRCPVPMLQDVPPFMRAAVRVSLTTALQLLRDCCETTPTHDEAPASRAWRLFFLAPRMLLARTRLHGPQGRDELLS